MPKLHHELQHEAMLTRLAHEHAHHDHPLSYHHAGEPAAKTNPLPDQGFQKHEMIERGQASDYRKAYVKAGQRFHRKGLLRAP